MFDHLLSFQVFQRAGLEAMWVGQASKNTAVLFPKDPAAVLLCCYCLWHLLLLLSSGALEGMPADPSTSWVTAQPGALQLSSFELQGKPEKQSASSERGSYCLQTESREKHMMLKKELGDDPPGMNYVCLP